VLVGLDRQAEEITIEAERALQVADPQLDLDDPDSHAA
jgi:hypothetical protein